MFPKKGGPQNGTHFFAYGVKVAHVNWKQEFEPELSLQTSLYGSYGRRLKGIGGYIYFSVRLNDYMTNSSTDNMDINWILTSVKGDKFTNQIWLGYNIGIQI